MKFDVVIGNPPYNNDLYIDFVKLGHSLSSNYLSMIIPAKWQAKGGYKNEQFRSNIVPYMSDIVFYSDASDLFDIKEWGGVNYFVSDKNIHKVKRVKNVCNNRVDLASDFEEHDEEELILHSHKMIQIIAKVGKLGSRFKSSLYVKNSEFKEDSMSDILWVNRAIYLNEDDIGETFKEDGYVDVLQGNNIVGYTHVSKLFTENNLDKYKCICSSMGGAASSFDKNNKTLGMVKLHLLKPYQVPKGSFPILRYFDTIEECKSFMSYMNTKLISFLYCLGCCGTTLTKEFFRFIPDQKEYNHVFTDTELYEKYSLSVDEISIIEGIIKARSIEEETGIQQTEEIL